MSNIAYMSEEGEWEAEWWWQQVQGTVSSVRCRYISKRPSFRIGIRKNRGHGWTRYTCLRVTLGPGTRPVSVQDTGMRKVPAAQDSISGSGLSWTHIAVDKNGNNTM